MLTPAFTLDQDGGFLIITIKVPYAKVADTEFFIEDTEFKFYCKPYYLRLTLPGEVVEDDRASAKYDADEGKFVVRLPKVDSSKHFEGLDMLTKLLAPAGKTHIKQPLIEVVEDPNVDTSDSEEFDEDFDWQIEQHPYVEAVTMETAQTYGFANQKQGVFTRLQAEISEIIDLPNADETPSHTRMDLRKEQEYVDFNSDHYLADLYEDEMIEPLLEFVPPWIEQHRKYRAGEELEDLIKFTEDELGVMRTLPRKEYLLDKASEVRVFYTLVDVLFAYAYNYRTTEGENTVESGWTIRKLSASLSWLQTACSLEDVLHTSMRRALCYPLYRHWKLAEVVVRDVVQIIALGKRQVLRCLLEVRDLLNKSEMFYIHNDLYINDYCVWIQTVKHVQLQSLSTRLSKIKLDKCAVQLDLLTIEQEAEALENELTESDSENSDSSETSAESDSSESSTDDSLESDSSESDSSQHELLGAQDNHDSVLSQLIQKIDNVHLDESKRTQDSFQSESQLGSDAAENEPHETQNNCNESDSRLITVLESTDYNEPADD